MYLFYSDSQSITGKKAKTAKTTRNKIDTYKKTTLKKKSYQINIK